jgi:hypothetical protein
MLHVYSLYDEVGSNTVDLLSVFILTILGPAFFVLLFADAFLGIERCTIRIGIPPNVEIFLERFCQESGIRIRQLSLPTHKGNKRWWPCFNLSEVFHFWLCGQVFPGMSAHNLSRGIRGNSQVMLMVAGMNDDQ